MMNIKPWMPFTAPQELRRQPMQVPTYAPMPAAPQMDPNLIGNAVSKGFAAGWGPDEPRKKSPLGVPGAPLDLSPQAAWNQPDAPPAPASTFDPHGGGPFANFASLLMPSAPAPDPAAIAEPNPIESFLRNGGGVY